MILGILIWLWRKILLLIYGKKEEIILVISKVEEKKEEIVIPWIEKYNIMYEKAEKRELTKEYKDGLINGILIEKTPNNGNVIMKYDNNKESFIYYCDSTPSYKILENVVKRYVCKFNCKELFVDIEKDIIDIRKEKEKKEIITNKVSSVKIEIDKENKYTKMEIDIKRPESQDIHQNRPQEINKKKIYIKNNSIRMTHMGKLANCMVLKKEIKKKITSYSDWVQTNKRT